MKKKNIQNSKGRADGARTAGDETENPAEERVVLAPFLGIRPRVYVAALYALVLAGVFFYVFLYPGIFHPGAEVTFTSLPEEASVLVDGVRIGATPLTAFVSEGSHVVSLRRPHFGEQKVPLAVGGRLFGSRVFPRRESLHAKLSLLSAEDLLRDAHREFSVWALGEATPLSPFPPVLSAAVRDYAIAAGTGADTEKELFAMLSSAAASVNSPASFRDFIYAAFLAASGGKALSPQALIRAAGWLLPLYARNEEALYWLILVLPEKAREELGASAWAAARLAELAAPGAARDTPPRAGAFRTIAGVSYAALPGGALRPERAASSAAGISRLAAKPTEAGAASSREPALKRMRESPPFTARADVAGFFLQTAEVTQAEYAAFLKENPAWQPAGRAALIRQGLAEDSYLASWRDSPLPPEPASPVSEVSFYAAAAYCEWLAGRDSRYVFFLPSEAQWEYAARAADSSGLAAMKGGVWEWCGDWYAPASYIFPVSPDFPAAEKVVRGGAWINSDSVTASTRGSQPPEWCGPYVGFRVAAAEKPLREPPAWMR
ncbi:MAG: SUMF1/EgtB/PvdO family nonheme iron enzyme [Spirochaetales bacterium]|jgi:formylglycine-generating enzyme required for sulfatase activity|nr:SUMF1/EgtB/PvdO family nonheme iron enzyme [Spirochaetales bacterium]